jgi:hypothetical protein
MKRFTQVALVLSIIMMLASPSEVWGQNRRTSSSSERKTSQSSNSSNSRSGSSSSNSRSSSSSSSSRRSGTSQSRTTSGNSQSRSTSSSTQRRTGVKASSGNTYDFKVDPNYKSPSSGTQSQSTSTRRRTTTTSDRQVKDYRGSTGSSSSSGSRSSTVTTRRSSSSSSAVTGSDKTSTRRSSSSSRQAVTTDRNRSAASPGTNRSSTTTTRRNATSVNSTVPRRTSDRGTPTVDRKPAAVQYHNSVPPPRDKNWVRPYIKKHYRPVPSYHYGHHYFGYRVHYLPYRAVLRIHNHIHYYYYDGIYYRPYFGGGYIICRPPVGSYISSTMLNVALTVAVINALNNAVERANRAVALAERYSRINTNYTIREVDSYVTNVANQNDEYYYQDGVFYTLSDGHYYVIEPPIGALVTQLPEDYVEVEIGGETYYQVEDALYKVTVIDGALYFEVVLAL